MSSKTDRSAKKSNERKLRPYKFTTRLAVEMSILGKAWKKAPLPIKMLTLAGVARVSGLPTLEAVLEPLTLAQGGP